MKEYQNPFYWPEVIYMNPFGAVGCFTDDENGLWVRLADGYTMDMLLELGYSKIWSGGYERTSFSIIIKNAGKEELEKLVEEMLSRPIPEFSYTE